MFRDPVSILMVDITCYFILSLKSGANSLYTRTHAISQTNTASFRNISHDGMFRGMYNVKQHHVADIAAVLSRAWSAGVDRINVSALA
ncbi:hypothetical protein PHJA_001785500 [Phtheirospermum japonicum]|uniref:Uncharacterized protein n=1 Tax=Phtheirospermum japonicum TaxID=374723 RepID=A0A830CJF4_9LAMI|nr:hypothetical protein PHJA_001785500 [Phtheirospermum japonicum]